MELQGKEINVKKMTILSILFPLFQGKKVNNPPPPLLSLSLSLSAWFQLERLYCQLSQSWLSPLMQKI